MQEYIAYIILSIVWFFGIAPLVFSPLHTESYIEDLKASLFIQGFLALTLLFSCTVAWAMLVVLQ